MSSVSKPSCLSEIMCTDCHILKNGSTLHLGCLEFDVLMGVCKYTSVETLRNIPCVCSAVRSNACSLMQRMPVMVRLAYEEDAEEVCCFHDLHCAIVRIKDEKESLCAKFRSSGWSRESNGDMIDRNFTISRILHTERLAYSMLACNLCRQMDRMKNTFLIDSSVSHKDVSTPQDFEKLAIRTAPHKHAFYETKKQLRREFNGLCNPSSGDRRVLHEMASQLISKCRRLHDDWGRKNADCKHLIQFADRVVQHRVKVRKLLNDLAQTNLKWDLKASVPDADYTTQLCEDKVNAFLNNSKSRIESVQERFPHLVFYPRP